MTRLIFVEMHKATFKGVSVQVLCISEPQKPGCRDISNDLIADSPHSYFVQSSFFTRETMILSFTMFPGLKFSPFPFAEGKGDRGPGCFNS